MQTVGEKLAIIADDLTGACDTACQFARYGFQPIILHSLDSRPAPRYPFVVVNSDSRKQEACLAHQKVLHLGKDLLGQGYSLFYKKMDSTLKGNWGAELSAVVKLTRPEIVVVAPAFPAWGRITIGGIQCAQGRPVFEPPASTSNLRPWESANLVEVLQAHFGNRVCLFRSSAVKKGPASLAKQMEAARFRGFPFQVFDALREDDLGTVALAGCRLECHLLWTGSAGLARYLPLGWGCKLKSERPVPPQSAEPALVINGSFNLANAAQLDVLSEAGFAVVVWIEDEDSHPNASTQVKMQTLLNALQRGANAAVSVRLNKPIRSADHLQRLQDALQSVAFQCLQLQPLAGTVIIGGDTAMNFYRKLGASALRIEGEVQPGIPYGRWVGSSLDGQPLVTKAGGFGQADTLVRAVEFLKGQDYGRLSLGQREAP